MFCLPVIWTIFSCLKIYKNSSLNLFTKLSKSILRKLAKNAWPTDQHQVLLVTVKDNTKRKKVPCIPPIFHNYKHVTGFKAKSETLNSFFANQCSLIPNNSILPSKWKLLTKHTFTSCDFSDTDILQIIYSQDSNKAHSHDTISICILKLFGEAIWRPLNMSKHV